MNIINSLIQILAATIGSFGFAILFNVRGNKLIAVFVLGKRVKEREVADTVLVNVGCSLRPHKATRLVIKDMYRGIRAVGEGDVS